MMKALLIVDLQNDFLPGGALAVQEGDLIIPIINQLQNDYELVIATQDWHPHNHQSFANQHPGTQPFQQIELDGITQTLWPEHCVQGNWGAKLSDQLNQNKISAIIRKGMNPSVDSYSAFFDNKKEHNTGLLGYLKERNLESIDICGLAADYCVFYSAIDALELGLTTTIITKATKAIDTNNFGILKKEFLMKGGHIL